MTHETDMDAIFYLKELDSSGQHMQLATFPLETEAEDILCQRKLHPKVLVISADSFFAHNWHLFILDVDHFIQYYIVYIQYVSFNTYGKNKFELTS